MTQDKKPFKPLGADFARQAALSEQLHRKPFVKPIRSPINVGQPDGSVVQQSQVTHWAPPSGTRAPHNRPVQNAATSQPVAPKSEINKKLLAQSVQRSKPAVTAK